jgi:hypothetical protein
LKFSFSSANHSLAQLSSDHHKLAKNNCYDLQQNETTVASKQEQIGSEVLNIKSKEPIVAQIML